MLGSSSCIWRRPVLQRDTRTVFWPYETHPTAQAQHAVGIEPAPLHPAALPCFPTGRSRFLAAAAFWEWHSLPAPHTLY